MSWLISQLHFFMKGEICLIVCVCVCAHVYLCVLIMC